MLVIATESFTIYTSKGRCTALYAASAPEIPPALAAQIKRYLSERSDASYNGNMVSLGDQVTLQKEVAAPENDIVPELKQTGWFRDPREEDEKTRFDKTAPLVSHPLSFRELEKYGYSDLVKPILELGGPFVVGSAIGYEWEEPTLELDESKRPERKESYAMDIDADLSVGSSFDEKLEKAAEMDLGKLKEELAAKEKAELDGTLYISPSMRTRMSNEPMDYSSIKKPHRTPQEAEGGEQKHTAITGLLQRGNIQAVTICGAFAYGRCTTEAAGLLGLDDTAVTIFAVSNVVIGFAVVLRSLARRAVPSSDSESPSVEM